MFDDDRRAVMAAAGAAAFRPGEQLFDVGDAIDKVHFVTSGAFSATIPMGDGSAVEVILIGPERAIGLLAAHGPVPAFGRVRAETPAAAVTVPSETFAKLVETRPALRRIVDEETASLVADIARSAACNAVHKLEPRLAKCLLRFHDRVAGDELALTQEHMSRMLGVSRTTLNAVAQSLQSKGVVRYTRGRLGIIDRRGLEGLACECYGKGNGAIREG